MSAEPAHTLCPNCGHTLQWPEDRYCRHCGQETDLQPPSVWGFVREFSGQYLSTHGAMARSLQALLVPGRLTQEYLIGRRRHYVLPLRLLLTVSLLVVLLNALLRVLAPLPAEHPATLQTDPHRAHAAALDDPRAPYRTTGLFTHIGQADGQFLCQGLSKSTCQRLKSQWQADPQQLAKLEARARSVIEDSYHWYNLLLTPWFALMTYALYFRRRRRFAEHMVLAMHLGAGVALINLLSSGYIRLAQSLGMNPEYTAWLFIAISFSYMALGWQRTFGGRWHMAVMRFALLLTGWGLGLVGVYQGLADLFWWGQ